MQIGEWRSSKPREVSAREWSKTGKEGRLQLEEGWEVQRGKASAVSFTVCVPDLPNTPYKL